MNLIPGTYTHTHRESYTVSYNRQYNLVYEHLKFIYKKKKPTNEGESQAWWRTAVIAALWETEAGRLKVLAQLGQFSETVSQNKIYKRPGGITKW